MLLLETSSLLFQTSQLSQQSLAIAPLKSQQSQPPQMPALEPLQQQLPVRFLILSQELIQLFGNTMMEMEIRLTQNQTVIISSQPLPTATSPQTFCIQQNATLSSIVITGQNIKWYDALTNGNLLANHHFITKRHNILRFANHKRM